MSKYLLIDDDAYKGWAQVLKAIIIKEIGPDVVIEAAIDKKEADIQLKKEWDVIFLDLRFGEGDYGRTRPEDLSGAKILRENIRNRNAVNFATPVIIFTASRKIWNIDRMIDLGADSYFIKESPYDQPDESFSQLNYLRFVKVIREYLDVGRKRKYFWNSTLQMIKSLNSTISNNNIRKRIEEKLLIAYGFLSGTSREFENTNFLFAKEAFAFLVYFSLFEEISKANYARNWKDKTDINWRILNTDEYLVKKVEDEDETIEVAIEKSGTSYKKANPIKKYHKDSDLVEYRKWTDNRLSIREQIIGLLILKYNYSADKIANFEKLNNKRNLLDFIHSSPTAILYETFRKNYNPILVSADCQNMFNFLFEILTFESKF